MQRFAALNIGAGETFDVDALPPEIRNAIREGIADTGRDLTGVVKKANADEILSSDLFGTRDSLKNNYLYRFVGAKLGLYGNSGEEAIYFGYFVDGAGERLDASEHRREACRRCARSGR
jgi:hypothetical protein